MIAKAKLPTVLDELELVRKSHGGILRPVDTVEFARDPETMLHSKFEWDNGVAGHQYRLWQAREIIRVAVTYTTDESSPIRVYVSLQEDRNAGYGGYRKLVEVLRDPTRRMALLSEAKAEMELFQHKYQELTELAGVFTEMRKAAKSRTRQGVAGKA